MGGGRGYKGFLLGTAAASSFTGHLSNSSQNRQPLTASTAPSSPLIPTPSHSFPRLRTFPLIPTPPYSSPILPTHTHIYPLIPTPSLLISTSSSHPHTFQLIPTLSFSHLSTNPHTFPLILTTFELILTLSNSSPHVLRLPHNFPLISYLPAHSYTSPHFPTPSYSFPHIFTFYYMHLPTYPHILQHHHIHSHRSHSFPLTNNLLTVSVMQLNFPSIPHIYTAFYLFPLLLTLHVHFFHCTSYSFLFSSH